jgi:hypothetical protein
MNRITPFLWYNDQAEGAMKIGSIPGFSGFMPLLQKEAPTYSPCIFCLHHRHALHCSAPASDMDAVFSALVSFMLTNR